MPYEHQKRLINQLQEILSAINEESINDDNFYNWLAENYFFQDNLEEIIYKINKAKQNL